MTKDQMKVVLMLIVLALMVKLFSMNFKMTDTSLRITKPTPTNTDQQRKQEQCIHLPVDDGSHTFTRGKKVVGAPVATEYIAQILLCFPREQNRKPTTTENSNLRLTDYVGGKDIELCEGVMRVQPTAAAAATSSGSGRTTGSAGLSDELSSQTRGTGPNTFRARLVGPEVHMSEGHFDDGGSRRQGVDEFYYSGGQQGAQNGLVEKNADLTVLREGRSGERRRRGEEEYVFPIQLGTEGVYNLELEMTYKENEGLSDSVAWPVNLRLPLLPPALGTKYGPPTARNKNQSLQYTRELPMASSQVNFVCHRRRDPSIAGSGGSGGGVVGVNGSQTAVVAERVMDDREPYCTGIERNTAGFWRLKNLKHPRTVMTSVLGPARKGRIPPWNLQGESEYEFVPRAGCRHAPVRPLKKTVATQAAENHAAHHPLHGLNILVVGDSHGGKLFNAMIDFLNGHEDSCILDVRMNASHGKGKALPSHCFDMQHNPQKIEEEGEKKKDFPSWTVDSQLNDVDRRSAGGSNMTFTFFWDRYMDKYDHFQNVFDFSKYDVVVIATGSWHAAKVQKYPFGTWVKKIQTIVDYSRSGLENHTQKGGEYKVKKKKAVIVVGPPAFPSYVKFNKAWEGRTEARIRRYSDELLRGLSMTWPPADSIAHQQKASASHPPSSSSSTHGLPSLRFVDFFRISEAWSHTVWDGHHFNNFVLAETTRQILSLICVSITAEGICA